MTLYGVECWAKDVCTMVLGVLDMKTPARITLCPPRLPNQTILEIWVLSKSCLYKGVGCLRHKSFQVDPHVLLHFWKHGYIKSTELQYLCGSPLLLFLNINIKNHFHQNVVKSIHTHICLFVIISEAWIWTHTLLFTVTLSADFIFWRHHLLTFWL